jgi:hypothetical protein
MRAIITVIAVIASASIAHATVHIPPGDAVAGTPIELVVEAPPQTPSLVAHYRTAQSKAFIALELVRKDDDHWVAIVPATAVVVPGVEYYIDAGGHEVFASAQWPHTTLVKPSTDDARRDRDIQRSEARRYRVNVMTELVDFGSKTAADGTVLTDRYYRVDADFAYRLWAYPLEELQFGYTRLLGYAPDQDMMSSPGAGFKVAGWFGLGLAAIEGVRVDGRLIVMATQSGFRIGTRGEARVGILDGSHVALGGEYLADVGASGYFRLGWGTVPGFPMSATVEATNLPASTNNVGVRLFYDLAHEVYAGFRLGVRVGYAARDQQISGFTSGATATVDF